MGRLGLDFLDNVADEMDLEKELADSTEADADIEMDSVAPKSEEIQSMSPTDVCTPDLKLKAERPSPTRSVTPAASPPTTSNVREVDLAALSARERNRLKRKRKPGNSAFVAPPSQSAGAKYSANTTGPSNKCVMTTLFKTKKKFMCFPFF
jgi:TATA-binding protein-associated factor